MKGHIPLEIPGQAKADGPPVPPKEGDSGEGELMIWALAVSCLCLSGLMALCPGWTAPTSATAWVPPSTTGGLSQTPARLREASLEAWSLD